MLETGASYSEAKAIVKSAETWSDGDYRKIVESQWSGKDNQDAKNLESLISRSEKWGDAMTTYRGLNLSGKELKNFTTEGYEIKPGALQSWTTNGGTAYQFSRYWQSGGIILRSQTQNHGTGIKHLSVIPEENEVLVSKKARYRVKSVTENYEGMGVTLVDVEEF